MVVISFYFLVPGWVYSLILFSWFLITLFGSFFIGWNYHLNAIHSNKKITTQDISLTFDDGPHPEFTPKTLELLKKHDAKATFFCIGANIEKHPELVKRILAEGHSLGNHTYSHSKSFGFFSTQKVVAELAKTIKITKDLTSKEMNMYRPAFGVTNPMIEKAVKNLNLNTIGWNVRSLDTTSRSEKQILKRITANIAKGDVVLLHDTSQKSINVLEQLLLFLEEKKLKSVTVDQLLDIKVYA
jgi:peptidoglycan/xylan/chitin deacetylase (PgdA/CDA1 family)